MVGPELILVSLHERYAVARSNLGFPHPITVVVSYPSQKDLPSELHLNDRIADLQRHFPLLYAHILGRDTSEPYFQQGERPISSDCILQHVPFVPEDDTQAQILRDELTRFQHLGKETLWQVTRYTSTGISFLALSCDHALTDGKGLFSLLDALLRDDISDLPYESVSQIPRMEDTLNVRLDAFSILGLVFRELLVPTLPRSLQSYLIVPPSWPAENVVKSPNQCPPLYTLIQLPHQLIASLKTAGRLHRVTTLHPILKLSYGVAIWSVVGRPQYMTLQSPASVRDHNIGHSHCTACYTSSFSVPFQPTSQTDFWAEAARVGAYMSSPVGQKRALQSMGSLGLIPNSGGSSPEQSTGWEKFFAEKMENKRIAESMGISNIGRVELPPRANDLCWGQAASPLSTPFEISVVGHAGGLRVAGAYREGSVVTAIQIKQVDEAWKRILHILADPDYSDTTLDSLVAVA